MSNLLLLTVPKAAVQLGVSPRTVGRLIESGKLKAHRVGRQRRIYQDNLDKYLEENVIRRG